MTGPTSIAALIQAVNYISINKIPGDIVECGVWRGGSTMAIAQTLLSHGDTERKLRLYDTFKGMPPSSDLDQRFDAQSAQTLLNSSTKASKYRAYADLSDVKRNLSSAGYPDERIHYVKGKVEDTIPNTIPK